MPTKAAQKAATKTMHPVAEALNKIWDELSVEFLEQRSNIEAELLAICSKEHSFGIGAPGNAKSARARAIFERFPGAEVFEIGLSKMRPDAAILGPYNLPELRDKGDFHRKIKGFIPTANFAFLDEIGKMSPTLGHELLSVLNERVYFEVNGGRSSKDVPLYTALTASNEMIVDESEDAAALWDRLLVRHEVKDIEESGNFVMFLQSKIRGQQPTVKTTIPFADLADAVDNVIPKIDVPLNVMESFVRLRDEVRAAQMRVSPRRWGQCIRLVQAAAFLNGHPEATEDDLHVLRFALWDTPDQIEAVERLCLSVSNPLAEECQQVLDQANEFSRNVRDAKGRSIDERATLGIEVSGKIQVLKTQLSEVNQKCLAAGRSTTRVDEVRDRLRSVERSVYVELMGMDPSAVNV